MTNTPETTFALLEERFRGNPRVTAGTGFGSSPGLRVDGKIFAMLADRQLVVKLPKGRVDKLVELRVGTNFDPGHGRLMREWLEVTEADADWESIALEAFEYVSRLAIHRPT